MNEKEVNVMKKSSKKMSRKDFFAKLWEFFSKLENDSLAVNVFVQRDETTYKHYKDINLESIPNCREATLGAGEVLLSFIVIDNYEICSHYGIIKVFNDSYIIEFDEVCYTNKNLKKAYKIIKKELNYLRS